MWHQGIYLIMFTTWRSNASVTSGRNGRSQYLTAISYNLKPLKTMHSGLGIEGRKVEIWDCLVRVRCRAPWRPCCFYPNSISFFTQFCCTVCTNFAMRLDVQDGVFLCTLPFIIMLTEFEKQHIAWRTEVIQKLLGSVFWRARGVMSSPG